MEDTTRENRRSVYEIVMSKTVEERFMMYAQMYEDAKAIARAALPTSLPHQDQEREIFKRIHGEYPEAFAARLY